MRHHNVCTAAIASLLTLAACSTDEVMPYSTYAEELVTLHTSATAIADRAVTDGGCRLVFSQPLAAPWAHTPDSLYRALLAFADDEDTATPYRDRATATVTPIRAEQVMVLTPRTPAEAKEWAGDSDPLALDALWIAADRRYLNMRISVKSGTTDSGTEKHTIGLVADTIAAHPGGTRHFHYRLCHNAHGIPQYYTTEALISIPAGGLRPGDTVSVAANTWSGPTQLQVTVRGE